MRTSETFINFSLLKCHIMMIDPSWTGSSCMKRCCIFPHVSIPLPPSQGNPYMVYLLNHLQSLLTILLSSQFFTVLLLIPTLSFSFVLFSLCMQQVPNKYFFGIALQLIKFTFLYPRQGSSMQRNTAPLCLYSLGFLFVCFVLLEQVLSKFHLFFNICCQGCS